MKKITFIILLVLLTNSICFSQTSVWVVKDKKNTVYLGGTIHILRSQDYPLPNEYNTAFSKADVLVFEADIKKMEDPMIGQKLMMKLMYQDERTLQSVLSEEAYQALEKECSTIGIPIANMAKFRPSMVILSLSVLKMRTLGVSATGVDKHFYSKAEKEDKKLSFFETLDQQIDMLVGMGEGYESEFVLYSLKDLNNIEEELLKMISSWREGSSTYISKLNEEMKTEYPEIFSTLLEDRNNNWMPKIESMFENDETEFVMVGVAHLHGPEGLLSQLKAKGYSVEQLK